MLLNGNVGMVLNVIGVLIDVMFICSCCAIFMFCFLEKIVDVSLYGEWLVSSIVLLMSRMVCMVRVGLNVFL